MEKLPAGWWEKSYVKTNFPLLLQRVATNLSVLKEITHITSHFVGINRLSTVMSSNFAAFTIANVFGGVANDDYQNL